MATEERRGVRSLLLIAFHFPPLCEGSGYLRTLKFAEHLPELGVRTRVLTVHPRAHGMRVCDIDDAALGVPVERAFALDTRRHLSVAGRYPEFLATPDRWASWWPAAVARGMRLARRGEIDGILSTYPIATAHRIGCTLKRRTGLPWIADYRDPFDERQVGAGGLRGAALRRLHQRVVGSADRVLLTTRGAMELYAERYQPAADKLVVVQNGFDESAFDGLEPRLSESSTPGRVTLVHSGVLYRALRDPRPFLDALAALKRSGRIDASRLRVVLRASGEEIALEPELASRAIEDLVEVAPGLPYREALAEMLGADGLLLFQGAAANRQIPAKVYEYLRAQRPIFALTHPDGETSRLLRESGVGTEARIDDTAAIASAFAGFVERTARGDGAVLSNEDCERYSRRARARELAALLQSL